MRLWAISDLHVDRPVNREGVRRLPSFGDDWLILAGDVAENGADLQWALSELGARFGKLFWTPGNHELWSRGNSPDGSGLDRYHRLVDICRRAGCVTPEDPYVVWEGSGGRLLIAPVFVLYDYSFRPSALSVAEALAWASDANVMCMDEILLETQPFAGVEAWCRHRVGVTQARLERVVAAHDGETVLVSHFPFRQCDVRLPQMPQFALWCGTRATEDWPRRFHARACIFGHLHVRRSAFEDGSRFEEVSLGYPGQWRPDLGVHSYLREVDVRPARVAPAAVA
jgi:hypothetical protein